jgi:lysophospholipase L1-like esterase
VKAARPLVLGPLVVASVVLALGLLEIGLRVVDAVSAGGPQGVVDSPKALHRQTPTGKRITANLDVVVERHPTSQRRTHVRTNRLGLRGPAVPAREPGELRVLVLGDSITFGDYVDEDETYPAALERRLQAALPGGLVRVINGGGPNVGTMDEAMLLADIAPELQPDLVLVGFYLNDSVDQAPYPARIRIPAGLAWSRLAERAASAWARAVHDARVRPRYVWVHEFLARGWVDDPAVYDRLVALASSDWGAAWLEESWAPVEAALRYMRSLGEQHGFQVAVAVFPVSVQVESRHEDDRPQQRIRALAESLGMPVADLLPALRASREERLFYDHCHLTPAGNAIVAEQITGLLLRAFPVVPPLARPRAAR